MIILVITKKGYRLGGFIDIPSGNIKNTTNSFCFSFDTQKLIYNTKYEVIHTRPIFINGFCVGFNSNEQKNCSISNNADFGFYDDDLYDFEAHRIYLE